MYIVYVRGVHVMKMKVGTIICARSACNENESGNYMYIIHVRGVHVMKMKVGTICTLYMYAECM